MKRSTILVCILAAATAFVLLGDPPPQLTAAVVEAVPHRPASAADSSTAAARERVAITPVRTLLDRAQLYPAEAGGVRRDLFASHASPPLPVPASAPDAAPTMPTFPYQYAGRKREGARWEVFLTKEEFSFVVRPGDSLTPDYRVDSIEPPTMVVTYLPMKQTQAISIGDAE